MVHNGREEMAEHQIHGYVVGREGDGVKIHLTHLH